MNLLHHRIHNRQQFRSLVLFESEVGQASSTFSILFCWWHFSMSVLGRRCLHLCLILSRNRTGPRSPYLNRPEATEERLGMAFCRCGDCWPSHLDALACCRRTFAAGLFSIAECLLSFSLRSNFWFACMGAEYSESPRLQLLRWPSPCFRPASFRCFQPNLQMQAYDDYLIAVGLTETERQNHHCHQHHSSAHARRSLFDSCNIVLC